MGLFGMLLVILFVLLLLIVLIYYYSYYKLRWTIKIPGPHPLPLIGNALDLGNCPADFLNALENYRMTYGGIFLICVGPVFYVIISDAELVEQILSSTKHITKGEAYDLLKPWLRDGLLISTSSKWKSRRRLLTPTFHFKILEKFVKMFNSIGDRLVEKLSEVTDKPIDIYNFINLYSLDVICETSMGTKTRSQDNHNKTYVNAVREYLDIFMKRTFSAWKRYDFPFQFSSLYEAYNSSLKQLHEFSNKVIKERRNQMGDVKSSRTNDDGIKERVALLDLLLTSEESSQLSDVDIQEEIDTFIFEGHDTVTSGISFALYALSVHPDIQKKIYEEIINTLTDDSELTIAQMQEMKYLDMFTKESLRKYPSVPMIQRRLEESWQIGGYEVPKGANLNLYIRGMQMDPKYFPNPEEFNPDRFLPENQSNRPNFCYVPFSAGSRNCIGQKFAIYEMKSAIIKIVKNFEIISVPNYEPLLGMAAILKSYNGIYVELRSRS